MTEKTLYRGFELPDMAMDDLHEAMLDVGTLYSAIATEIRERLFEAEIGKALKEPDDEYDPWDNGLVG